MGRAFSILKIGPRKEKPKYHGAKKRWHRGEYGNIVNGLKAIGQNRVSVLSGGVRCVVF